MPDDFSGKVVLITGAGRGGGRALAEAFAARGARVAANDISPVNLDPLVAQSRGKIRAYVEDVAKKVGAQAVVKQAEDDFGQIDILINHAAVEPRLSLLDMDEWDWHRVLDVNLTGAFLMMQSVGRMMKEKGSGVIINLIMAGVPLEEKREAAYLASMSGLIALTRAAAQELSPFGVRVHAVGTGLQEYRHSDADLPHRDLAQAVLHLCQNRSLNGQIVSVEA
ncbi:MAG TPA: SDR family oxidoreductase [Anaerolineales bacterium]|nr:SDR family oxidoreductase [Anaerolineales bacterium]